MQTFTIHKAAVRSGYGLVAAQNRHAAEAGAAVLSRGGNAIDAAIVTSMVLSVVEPWLSGVGGGGFLVRADGTTGAVDTLEFNVRAAEAVDPKDYPLTTGDGGSWFNWPAVVGERNVSGYSSICVPGAIAGYAAALEKYGTISFAEALQPAIAHAERGAGTRLVRRSVYLDRRCLPGQISCQQRALAGRRSRAKGVRSERAALQADAGQGENAQAAGAGWLSRLL